jgi:hypothetical protein
MVAIYSHGQLLVMPTFSHRVVGASNAGITLFHATVGDSGNYTVEIQIFQQSGNTYIVMRRSVFLQISGKTINQGLKYYCIKYC